MTPFCIFTSFSSEIKVKGEKRSNIPRCSSDSKLYYHSRSEETGGELYQAELQLPSMSAFDKSREFLEKLRWPDTASVETETSDSDFWSEGAASEIELARGKGEHLYKL